jgi:hypothetical protein
VPADTSLPLGTGSARALHGRVEVAGSANAVFDTTPRRASFAGAANAPPNGLEMKVMLAIWAFVLVGGLAYFIVIGLSHH